MLAFTLVTLAATGLVTCAAVKGHAPWPDLWPFNGLSPIVLALAAVPAKSKRQQSLEA